MAIPLHPRVFPYAVAGTLLGLTLWPLVKDPRQDGFPLSTYPMFATHRPRLQTVHHAVARTPAGEGVPARPALLGTSEVMQAIVMVGRAIAAGPAEAQALCLRVADRIAASAHPGDARFTSVEIRSDTYDAVAYFAGDRRARNSQVHTSCPVRAR